MFTVHVFISFLQRKSLKIRMHIQEKKQEENTSMGTFFIREKLVYSSVKMLEKSIAHAFSNSSVVFGITLCCVLKGQKYQLYVFQQS